MPDDPVLGSLQSPWRPGHEDRTVQREGEYLTHGKFSLGRATQRRAGGIPGGNSPPDIILFEKMSVIL